MPSRSRDDSQHRWWELTLSIPAPRGPLGCTPHHTLYVAAALHVARGVGVPPPVLPVGDSVVYLYLSWDWSWHHGGIRFNSTATQFSMGMHSKLAGTANIPK